MKTIRALLLSGAAALALSACEPKVIAIEATAPKPEIRPSSGSEVITRTEYVEIPDPDQTNRIDGLIAELEASDRMFADLSNTNSGLEAQTTALQREIDRLERELTRYQRALEQSRAQEISKESEIRQLEKNYQQTVSDFQYLIEEYGALSLRLDRLLQLRSIANKLDGSMLNCTHFSSRAAAEKFHRLIDPYDQQRLDGHSQGRPGKVCETRGGPKRVTQTKMVCSDFTNDDARSRFRTSYQPFRDLLVERVDDRIWQKNGCE